jgi:hypothetical protein
VIQPAAVNQPRWDYTGSVLRGLLIEEARTNLLLTSVIGAGWSLTNTTLTGGQAGAPDGTANMTRVVETTANSYHDVERLTTVAASTTYTASIYAKAAEVRYLQIFIDNGAAVGGYATFDLQTGTISGPLAALGAGVIDTAAIQSFGGGVYRCSIATTIGANTSARLGFALANTGTPTWPPQYIGNASNGLLLWGAQLEQGAFPTSYIPTTSVAATRAVDLPSLAIGPWYASPGGSWMAEVIRFNSNIEYYHLVQTTFSSGVFQLAVRNDGAVAQYDGAALVGIETSGVGVVVKCAASWATGSAKVVLNGGVVTTSAGLVTGYATAGPLALIQTSVPTQSMTGYVRRIQYWPRALSDAEMQAVTA